jgi:hypothetical protein
MHQSTHQVSNNLPLDRFVAGALGDGRTVRVQTAAIRVTIATGTGQSSAHAAQGASGSHDTRSHHRS